MSHKVRRDEDVRLRTIHYVEGDSRAGIKQSTAIAPDRLAVKTHSSTGEGRHAGEAKDRRLTRSRVEFQSRLNRSAGGRDHRTARAWNAITNGAVSIVIDRNRFEHSRRVSRSPSFTSYEPLVPGLSARRYIICHSIIDQRSDSAIRRFCIASRSLVICFYQMQ